MCRMCEEYARKNWKVKAREMGGMLEKNVQGMRGKEREMLSTKARKMRRRVSRTFNEEKRRKRGRKRAGKARVLFAMSGR